jgi:hypothetical protein
MNFLCQSNAQEDERDKYMISQNEIGLLLCVILMGSRSTSTTNRRLRDIAFLDVCIH